MEERHLEKAKQHTNINLHPALTTIGVTPVHEDKQHQEISSTLQSIHPEVGTSKDAVVPQIEPTPNLIHFPEKMDRVPITNTQWGFVHMARKLKERYERRRAKEPQQSEGELPNAA